jgi:hypothetical protein
LIIINIDDVVSFHHIGEKLKGIVIGIDGDDIAVIVCIGWVVHLSRSRILTINGDPVPV